MSIIAILSALTIYSLVFGAALAIMWGAWRLSKLRHHTDFALNRGALMGAVIFAAAAAALPFVVTQHKNDVTESMPSVKILSVGNIATTEAIDIPVQAPPTHRVISMGDITAVYTIGLIISLMVFAGKLIYIWCVIWRAKAAGTNMSIKGVRLRGRSSSAPFTWGRWIVMSEHDYATHRQAILAHETVHRRQGHWIDLIVLRAAGALTWYLPVVPLIRRDLVQCHEYSADAGAISSGIDSEAYQMMLIEHASGRMFHNPLVNSFNFCSIKNRIIMMQNKRSATSAWTRALTFIPAVALTIAAVSTPALASAVHDALPTEATVTPAANDPDKAFTTVEVKPEYKGGAEKMWSDIATRIKYPEEAANQNIQGRVVVQIVIEKDGSVSDPKVIKSVHPLLDAEAIRVVKTLSDFTPGMMEGKPVRVRYMLPIAFRLQDTTENAPGTSSAIEVVSYNREAANNSDEAFTTAEVMPEYKGGAGKMWGDIATRIKYPEEAANQNIQGRVVVQFVVEKDGSVSDHKVMKSVHPLLDAEAIRVVKTLNEFTPGKMGGKPVRVHYTLPITFRLGNSHTAQ